MWTRDLSYHGHEENGLKRMIEIACGFDTKKLKIKKGKNLSREDWLNKEKFGYIRAMNWNRKDLDSRQLCYMASDVTLAGTIVFDIMISLIMQLGLEVLDNSYKNILEFVTPYFVNIIDRKIDQAQQHPSFSVPAEARSLIDNHAALQLSVQIEDADECSSFMNSVTEEERRKRMALQIKEVGENRLNSRKPLHAEWQKVPSERTGVGRKYAENLAVETWE